MKMVIVMLALILSFSFVTAYDFSGSRMKFGGDIDYKYHNNDRWMSKTFDSWGGRTEKFGFDGGRRFGEKVSGEDSYYRYVQYFKKWEKVSCYNTLRKNRIFYIEC